MSITIIFYRGGMVAVEAGPRTLTALKDVALSMADDAARMYEHGDDAKSYYDLVRTALDGNGLEAVKVVGSVAFGVAATVGVGLMIGSGLGAAAVAVGVGVAATKVYEWAFDEISQKASGSIYNNPSNPPGTFPLGDSDGNGIPDIHENRWIDPKTGQSFKQGQNWVQRRDPLTLDLDGDGLETIGIAATNPIQFDHDGDGIKNGTGWVLSDDAFLVLDKNGNGSIDNGRELFGDSTIKSNGQTAVDGFDALADLDSNADGKISNLDAQFANLRLWRDLNQDGISQTGELFTLTQLNISSINVTKTANSQTLANGNQIADLGTFTKTDGATGNVGAVTGNMADINLASDTFHRTFPNVLDTTSVATLPDMQGSGAVRDLREAATQSTTLQNLLTEYSATTTRAGQMALIDQLLDAWADTGGLAETSQTRHCERSEAIQTLLDKLNILPLDSSILVQTYSPISMRLSRMNNQLQLVYSAGTTLAVAKHTFECLNRTKLTTFSLNTNKTAVNNDEWRIAV